VAPSLDLVGQPPLYPSVVRASIATFVNCWRSVHEMEACKDIVAGTVAGVSGILVTQPLDIIRVRLQTQAESGGHRVSGMRAAAKHIYRTQGVLGFFRGMAAPLLANAPINATIFATERGISRWLSASAPGHGSSGLHFIAGAISGLAQVPFSVPAELIKLQLQVDHGSREPYTSSWQCARSIASEHGLRGLFRGTALTAVRDTSAFGVYFAVYHELRGWFLRRQATAAAERGGGLAGAVGRAIPTAPSTNAGALPQVLGSTAAALSLAGVSPVLPQPTPGAGFAAAPPRPAPAAHSPAPLVKPTAASTFALMMSGGVAGVASWLFTYPVDVCKSLVQGLPLSTPRAERTLAAVLKHNRGLEGSYRFLARGLTPTLARAFPCSAVVFPVFEWTLTMLESSSPDSHQDELHHVS